MKKMNSIKSLNRRHTYLIRIGKYIDFRFKFKPVINTNLVGKAKKILFLDIDGVLNTPSTYFNKRLDSKPLNEGLRFTIEELKYGIDEPVTSICDNYEKELIDRLQEIIDNIPDLYICICSSNRYNMSLSAIKQMLDNYGLQNYKLLGATPVLMFKNIYESDKYIKEKGQAIDLSELIGRRKRSIEVRGREVEYILKAFKPTTYAILDDMNDYLKSQQHSLVKVDGTKGITKENVYSIINILNR